MDSGRSWFWADAVAGETAREVFPCIGLFASWGAFASRSVHAGVLGLGFSTLGLGLRLRILGLGASVS